MKKSLLMSLLLATTLVACSNNAVKEKPAAPVVDGSKSSQVSQPKASAKDDVATTVPASKTEVAVNPLKDPNNILS
jgi:peptidoglycan-associated lipoprotein